MTHMIAWVDVASLMGAALVGLLARKYSVCHVRAVEAALARRDLRPLAAQLMAAVWAMAAAWALSRTAGMVHAPIAASAGVVSAAFGGLLFGLGAAMNGGCSISTVTRLARGELAMLATLTGFVLAIAGAGLCNCWPSGWMRAPLYFPQWLEGAAAGLRVGGAFLAMWLAVTLVAAWCGGASPSWSLAWHLLQLRGMALLGVLAGALYAAQGPWSYSGTLRGTALAWTGADSPVGGWRAGLALALLAGAMWPQRDATPSLLRRPSMRVAVRHLVAGAVMGLGATLVPGGNDTVLLNQLPMAVPTAAAAWIAMCAGIALGMVALASWQRTKRMPATRR